MIVTKMTASFGGLQNKTLVLAPGLNIIEAPNESGKSTWSAFLAAMFYGIDGSQRDRRDSLADKNRYAPWNGAPMEGSLECIFKGRELILERSGNRTGAPMSLFTARYKSTGKEVPGLNGGNAGLKLLGVERDVFQRSAFIRQAGITVDQSPDLERRIMSLVSSGEEEVSWSETEKQLQSWKNRRRHNKTGLLPGLEEEIAKTDGVLRGLSSIQQKIALSSSGLEASNRKIADLTEQMELFRKRDRQQQNMRLRSAREDMEEAARKVKQMEAELNRYGPVPDEETLRRGQETIHALEQKREEVKQAKERCCRKSDEASAAEKELGAFVFCPLSPDEAWQQAQQAAGRYGELEKKSRFRPVLLALFCALLFAAVGAVLILSRGKPTIATALALAAAALLTAFPPIFLFRWYKRRMNVLTEMDRLLSDYGVKKPEEILEYAAKYREAFARARQSKGGAGAETQTQNELETCFGEMQDGLMQKVRAFAPDAKDVPSAGRAIDRALSLRMELESARIRLDGLKKLYESVAAMGGDPEEREEPVPAPGGDRKQVEAELEQARRASLAYEKNLAMAIGEQKAQGDPAGLAAGKEELVSRAETLEEEYKALALAQSALQTAHETMEARFSPELNRRAGEIMSAFTGGKYKDVLLDRSFAASVRTGEDAVSRRSIALSRGTSDQLYLAVRLAICDLVLPAAERPPLVLDDALSDFDDRRMARTLDYLVQRAKEGQIILFTCQSREASYLRSADGVHIGGM